MAAGLVFTGQGRLKGSFFAPARTEIPLFRALVAVVGAARAGGEVSFCRDRVTMGPDVELTLELWHGAICGF